MYHTRHAGTPPGINSVQHPASNCIDWILAYEGVAKGHYREGGSPISV